MRKIVTRLFGLSLIIVVFTSCTPTVGKPTSSSNKEIIAAPTQTLSPVAATLTLSPTLSPTPLPATLTAIPEIAQNGVIARQHIEELCTRGVARKAGSAEEARAARYIQSVFEKLGYDTYSQLFTFDTDEETLSSANIMASMTGNPMKQIIVGAHYDSTGPGNGADDNASGVGVMLEVAEKIRNIRTPYSVRFVAFGAEENDLDGSYYFVETMSKVDYLKSVAMINLDSITAGDKTFVYGEPEENSLRAWIMRDAKKHGFNLDTKLITDLDEEDGTPCECADYAAFQDAGIPIVYFEATNWDVGERDGWTQVDPRFGRNGQIWHTKFDSLEYLDKTFPGRVDEHLNTYVTLLVDALTQYEE